MKTPKEILEELVNYEVKKALGYAPNDYADKTITQALSSLSEWVKSYRVEPNDGGCYECGWSMYNDAIDTIADSLTEGKEREGKKAQERKSKGVSR